MPKVPARMVPRGKPAILLPTSSTLPTSPRTEVSDALSDRSGPETDAELVEVCTPACAGNQCGPDGCGGTCGECPFDECVAHAVLCEAGEAEQYKGCFELDEGAMEECISEIQVACLQEVGLCKLGIWSCLAKWNCAAACPLDEASGQLCVHECVALTGSKWETLKLCLKGDGYWQCAANDDACRTGIFSHCIALASGCQYGETTCGEARQCAESCDAADAACEAGCVWNAVPLE